jgi:starvation-inducible outer membrane lipoprotein
MQDAPSKMNAVPSNAERALNMKKDARFGASAVAILSRKNKTVVNSVICAI